MNATCYIHGVREEVSAKRAAEMLDVSPETIRMMIINGELPARKTGGGTHPWAIPVDELNKVSRIGRGAVTLTEDDLAEAAQIQVDYLATKAAADALYEKRAKVVARLARKATGYGALAQVANAMKVHRITITRAVKEGEALLAKEGQQSSLEE